LPPARAVWPAAGIGAVACAVAGLLLSQPGPFIAALAAGGCILGIALQNLTTTRNETRRK